MLRLYTKDFCIQAREMISINWCSGRNLRDVKLGRYTILLIIPTRLTYHPLMTYTLGIDIGTSKIAAVIISAETKELVCCSTAPTHASLSGPAGWFEQDVSSIWQAIERVLEELPAHARQNVSAIGVTGQMHGVIGWKKDFHPKTLVTWQDQRVLEHHFLSSLNKEHDCSLHAGYGWATLAWYVKNQPEWFDEVVAVGTIQDYFVARLCDSPLSKMDPTNAASWGLFDVDTGFDLAIIKAFEIPPAIVPTLVLTGSVAGKISQKWSKLFSLPNGVPVQVAIGDNQASLLSSIDRPEHQISLTLGTGGQVTVIEPSKVAAMISDAKGMERRPYVNGQTAMVGASLCGGSAWKWLIQTAANWLSDLGVKTISEDSLYERISTLGLAAEDSQIEIKPYFLGERYDPDLRGSIENLNLGNMSLGNLANSLAEAIIKNLKDLLPATSYDSKREIVGSGNGLRKSHLLRKKVEEVFGLPLVLSKTREEAAQGAAQLAIRSIPESRVGGQAAV